MTYLGWVVKPNPILQASGSSAHNLQMAPAATHSQSSLGVMLFQTAEKKYQIAMAFPNLQPITGNIPELCLEAEILLLLGRGASPLHNIHEPFINQK